MILPKGQPLHENLNTSYTNFEQLVQDLKTNQLTGYVRVLAWKYEGVLFLDTGNLVNVVEEAEGKRRVGLAALESVKARAKEKDATLSVYHLDGELTALIAGSAQRDALYEALSNDLTSFDLLMAKLKKEAHTGHIEIALKDGGAGLVFLQNGAVAATVYSVNGATVTGDDALKQLDASVSNGATFNVYKSDPTSALGQDFMRLEVLDAWQTALAAVANQVDRASKPGTFATAFKRACLDQVAGYPFLDPFAGEFEFKDGRITFQGHATVSQFNAGVGKAFTGAARQLNPASVTALRQALAALDAPQRAALQTWGIADALAEFFTG